jgi:hypothetical protein
MKQAFTILIVLLAFCSGYGKDMDNWASLQDSSVLYEKVYLHADREYYAPGDTLWFKSYLVSALTNKLEPGYKNIYVQLLSPKGKVIANRLLMSVYGTSYGDILLKDSLISGQYTLRAATRYLEGFGEKSCFHKRIWIGKSGDFELKDSTQIKKTEIGEVLFFPEGGNLVVNAANHVAFKAIGKDGKGMEVSGKISDSEGHAITTFKTTFLGMGQFIFMPKEGEKYNISIDNHPEYHCQLPAIQNTGLALHSEQGEKDIMVSLSRNYKQEDLQSLTLVANHKGVVLFYKSHTMDGFKQGIKLSKINFPLGITKISVYDNSMNILAERLVFISDGQLSSVKINTDKKEYAAREKVSLSLEPVLAKDDSITSTLSLAVVNEGYFSAEGNTQTIQSYLLLDSELKGAIESPARYFVNEDSISSDKKLDLLMMVQGWRSYYWDDIIKSAPKDMAGWDDAGITVSGVMKRLFREKTIAGGNIQLSSFSPLMVEKTQTDSLGRFCFKRLFLKDSAEVKLSGVNENKGKSVQIIPDMPAPRDTLFGPDSINRILPAIGIPMKYVRENYFKQLTWQDYDPDKGSILLEGVKISGRSKNTIKQVDFYKPSFYNVDNSYLITPADYKYKYVNNLLIEKAKLPVGQWRIDSYGAEYSVLAYCVDGEYITVSNWRDDSERVLNIPIKNVYQIDVDKMVYNIDALVYVYTRKFELAGPSRISVRGNAIFNVQGFQKPRKFYSPAYTPENINLTMMDYRPTLYWSPEVVVKDGKASMDFFTCDHQSDNVIIVEGISSNGKICFGAKRFSVNKQRGN